jgi:hypothetical protein
VRYGGEVTRVRRRGRGQSAAGAYHKMGEIVGI